MQSFAPQVHTSLELEAVPSVVVQGAVLPHLLTEERQNNPLAAMQLLVPHLQSTELAEDPPLTSHADPGPHVWVKEVQYNPVDVVQSLAPQVHSMVFAELPSVVLQASTLAQLLRWDQQYNPFSALQTPLVPHLQSTELAEDPSSTVHAVPGPHVLVDEVQNNPVAESQIWVLQMHLLGFG